MATPKVLFTFKKATPKPAAAIAPPVAALPHVPSALVAEQQPANGTISLTFAGHKRGRAGISEDVGLRKGVEGFVADDDRSSPSTKLLLLPSDTDSIPKLATAASARGDAGNNGDEADELDAFVTSLVEEAEGVAIPAPPPRRHAHHRMVTLEELTAASATAAAVAAAAAFGAKHAAGTPDAMVADNSVAGNATTGGDEDAVDEAYHKRFMESIKAAGDGPPPPKKSKKSKTPAAVTESSLPDSAADSGAGVRVEEEYATLPAFAPAGEDFDEAISYATGPVKRPKTERSSAPPSDGTIPSATVSSSSSSSTALALVSTAAAREPDEEDTLYKGEEWGSGSGKSALEVMHEKLSKKELKAVDHSKIDYIPIRKCLYIEPREVSQLTPEQVAAIREDDEIKIRGKNVPKPLMSWEQSGLPDRVITQLCDQYKQPFAIQRQALPVIMSGRDVIGVARTGSGKTLAYLLPMLRQILDQPPLNEGDGPIGLVLAPSRELVSQIYRECRRFAKCLDLRVTAIYGGASTGEQIADLKRGAEIVVATPGRLIDLLTLNAGKVIALHRVSYVVLDEADRMFDMGFEPQIARILGNTRPDRQTVLFSATFPEHVESLARKVLRTPVEIVVGGRSKASSDVTQFVEIHDEGDKFPRLLQLLGEWYERGCILVFVDTKEHCDMLYGDLLKLGYPTLSLHGGKDQIDRDQTISDFKNKVGTVLIATSVAGRGLDVKDLVLVVNYSCPNHLEDYVHRVGRTGRAGRKGTAYTFITPNEAMYAGDMMRALKDAKQPQNISPQLVAMHEEHVKKVASGEARKHHSGYATKGYKFDENELSAAQTAKEAQRKMYELEAGIKDMSELLAEDDEKKREKEMSEREARGDVDGDGEVGASTSSTDGASGGKTGTAGAPGTSPLESPPPSGFAAAGTSGGTAKSVDVAALAQLRARVAAARAACAAGLSTPAEVEAAVQALAAAEMAGPAVSTDVRAAAFAVAQAIQAQLASSGGVELPVKKAHFEEELEVNEYPVRARTRALRREALGQVQDATHTTITVKGVFVEAGRRPPPDERKLYLLIEGGNEGNVRKARNDIRRALEEETLRLTLTLDRGGSGGGGGAGAGYSKFTV